MNEESTIQQQTKHSTLSKFLKFFSKSSKIKKFLCKNFIFKPPSNISLIFFIQILIY